MRWYNGRCVGFVWSISKSSLNIIGSEGRRGPIYHYNHSKQCGSCMGCGVAVWSEELLQGCGILLYGAMQGAGVVQGIVWCCCRGVMLLQECGVAAGVWCCCRSVVLLQDSVVVLLQVCAWCCCRGCGVAVCGGSIVHRVTLYSSSWPGLWIYGKQFVDGKFSNTTSIPNTSDPNLYIITDMDIICWRCFSVFPAQLKLMTGWIILLSSASSWSSKIRSGYLHLSHSHQVIQVYS